MKFNNNVNTEGGFDIFEDQYIESQGITTGSNYMFANGYVGYRGTLVNGRKEDYVACIVSDTYDNADGKWRELCNAPNGLFLDLKVDGEALVVDEGLNAFKRQLDLSNATLSTMMSNKKVIVTTERFASMDRLHVLVMRYTVKASCPVSLEVETGIDGDVWNINGEHFVNYNLSEEEDNLLTHTVTGEFATDLYVAEGLQVAGSTVETTYMAQDKKNIRQMTMTLEAGEEVTFYKYVTIFSSNDVDTPKVAALSLLKEMKELGFEGIRASHNKKWEALWSKYDIKIQGSLRDETLTRFNLYHNIIHTPTHALLPLGARGLSCQAYQGAAFWDEEIFNLPMYLYTNPKVAKNILMYRYETLDGARDKAKRLGYRGAFYAWISGKSGEELCPDFFFKDIITGRKIRNHFNIWQIHVSSDIAYTIWRYYEVTGDLDFILDYGAEMMLDISLFLLTRSFYNVDKDRYEYIRLLGPDEYHENVDNNVFTNYQAKYTLEKTMEVVAMMMEKRPKQLASLLKKLEISETNMKTFEMMIEKIYIKEAGEDKVIEQFDHYFQLEDIKPADLATRLIDKAEYWGWPNGIAVHTQVLKQADLIQLFVMHDDFDKDTLKANFEYYEPRTEHGSSLSPAMYSIIASKVGYDEMAYDYFVKSCTVDLYNANKAISGGTFIGGIHTASCGAVWQMIIFGFAGFSEYDNILHFKPKMPEEWDGFEFKVHHKNNFLEVVVNKEKIIITSKADNVETLKIKVYGKDAIVAPGNCLVVEL